MRLTVQGRVQGVFFRAFVARSAEALGLNGYVRNLPDGRSVEVHAEGDETALRKLVEKCREGPPGSRIEEVVEERTEGLVGLTTFEVRY